MGTSGSFNWTLNRDQIITSALRKLGVLEQGETPAAQQITDAAEALNMMVKEWQNDGVRLWTLAWTTKVLSAASSEVTGTDGKIYTCILGHTSSSENKPVTGTDYSTFWKERGTTGGAWANATAYLSIGDFYLPTDTIGIERAFIRYNEQDYPVRIIGWGEWFDLSDKSNIGRPLRITVDMDLAPRAVLNPIPDRTDYVLHYLRVRKLEDFDANTNTGDFPERWLKAVVWGLAADLAPEYGVPVEERDRLEAKSGAYYFRAKARDMEIVSSPFADPAYSVDHD